MLKVINGGIAPTRGSKYSAAIDLYSNENVTIGAGETKIIPLGVCLDEDNFPIYVANNKHKLYLQLEPRSSLRTKGLIAGTGVIDIDYKDEIGIIIHNPICSVGARYLNHSEEWCPKCGQFQINDDDGVYLESEIGSVYCPDCDTDFTYVKNFLPTPPDFPYDCEKEWINTSFEESKSFQISKGDKIAQIMLCEHKTYLLGIESQEERQGGYGSTGN